MSGQGNCDAAPSTVAALRVVAGQADYYNLTVSVLHTYAVGDGAYVVHNCGVSTVDPTDPRAFEIVDRSGYPTNGGCCQPDGPFKLLSDAEYDSARIAGNQGARAYRSNFGVSAPDQAHHIQPIQFGGHPSDPNNLMPLASPWPHQEYTNWWNGLRDELRAGNLSRIRFINNGGHL